MSTTTFKGPIFRPKTGPYFDLDHSEKVKKDLEIGSWWRFPSTGSGVGWWNFGGAESGQNEARNTVESEEGNGQGHS